MKLLLKQILLVLLTLFCGCIKTYMNSYSDPSYQHHTVDRMVVIAPNLDFEYRELLEKRIVKNLKNNGILAIISLKVFPPTRKINDSQMNEILKKKAIKSILVVELTSGESGSKLLSVNTFQLSNTIYSMPVSMSHRTTHFRASLLISGVEHPIWVSTSKTKADGSFYTGVKTTLNNYADKLVKELQAKGHI